MVKPHDQRAVKTSVIVKQLQRRKGRDVHMFVCLLGEVHGDIQQCVQWGLCGSGQC